LNGCSVAPGWLAAAGSSAICFASFHAVPDRLELQFEPAAGSRRTAFPDRALGLGRPEHLAGQASAQPRQFVEIDLTNPELADPRLDAAINSL